MPSSLVTERPAQPGPRGAPRRPQGLSDPSARLRPERRKGSAARRRAALRGVGPPSPARGSPARGGGVPLPAAGAARPAPAQRGTDSCPERAPARRSPALPCPRAARSHPAPPPHPWTAGRWAAGPCRRCEPGRGAAEPRAAGTMDSILEPFAAERLFPAAGPGFLDLGDFSEADFLSNVVRGAARRRPARGARPESPLPALCSRSAFLFFRLICPDGALRPPGETCGAGRMERGRGCSDRAALEHGGATGRGVLPPGCSQLLGQRSAGETKRLRPGVGAGTVCFREQSERNSDLGKRAAASPKEPKRHCSPLRKLPGLPEEPCEPRTPQLPPSLPCREMGAVLFR